MKKYFLLSLIIIFAAAVFPSCKKTLAPEPEYIDYYSISVMDTAWFPASLPAGFLPFDRAYTFKSGIDGTGHEGAPVLVKILELSYTNMGQENWDAFRQVVSLSGEDLSGFKYIDLWLKASTNNPVNLTVDLGIISEDSNGNGLFELNTVSPFTLKDSEDINGNGLLENWEDIGISPGIYGGMPGFNPVYWGANNASLDSEDMNKNGRLDTEEHFYRFSYPQNPELQFSGFSLDWRHIKLSLKNYSQAVGISQAGLDPYNPEYLSDVRHIRIIISGASVTPTASGGINFDTINITRY